MPKISTETIVGRVEDSREMLIAFQYSVMVNSMGVFSTTLPVAAVATLKSYGLTFTSNNRRNSREGYIEAASKQELIQKVKEIVNKAVSREVVDEYYVIEYSIATNCSYVKDGKTGTIYPNGTYTKEYNKTAFWVEGTDSSFLTDNTPFSAKIYVRPKIKRTYKYGNGEKKIEYVRYYCGYESKFISEEPGEWFKWLASIPKIGSEGGGKIQYIEYTEATAYFFVRFIKMIMELSDKIKDITDPDGIRALIENGFFQLPVGTKD